MAVAVHFPDGSISDVPGQLRKIASADNGLPSFEQVPLNCSARWIYVHRDGKWCAEPRQARVTILQPPVQTWWSSIVQMEESVPARQLQTQQGPTRMASRQWNSAA